MYYICSVAAKLRFVATICAAKSSSCAYTHNFGPSSKERVFSTSTKWRKNLKLLCAFLPLYNIIHQIHSDEEPAHKKKNAHKIFVFIVYGVCMNWIYTDCFVEYIFAEDVYHRQFSNRAVSTPIFCFRWTLVDLSARSVYICVALMVIFRFLLKFWI